MSYQFNDSYKNLQTKIYNGCQAGLKKTLVDAKKDAIKEAKTKLINVRDEYEYEIPQSVLNSIKGDRIVVRNTRSTVFEKQYSGIVRITADDPIAKYIEYGTGLVGAGKKASPKGCIADYPIKETVDGESTLTYSQRDNWRYKGKKKVGITSGQIGSAFMYSAREKITDEEYETKLKRIVKDKISKELQGSK